MTEKFLGLFDYVSGIAPHGMSIKLSLIMIGGMALVSGLVIVQIAIRIDRLYAKLNDLANDVSGLSRKIDCLALAMEDRRRGAHMDVNTPTGEAGDSEASLEEIRKRLEALSARTEPKRDVERR